MFDKLRLLVPAALFLAGMYFLAISFGASGETVWMLGYQELPKRFGYLLGGICTFGGLVIGIDMVFGNRPHRGAETPKASHTHQSAA